MPAVIRALSIYEMIASARELYKSLLHVPRGPQLPMLCMLGV